MFWKTVSVLVLIGVSTAITPKDRRRFKSQALEISSAFVALFQNEINDASAFDKFYAVVSTSPLADKILSMSNSGNMHDLQTLPFEDDIRAITECLSHEHEGNHHLVKRSEDSLQCPAIEEAIKEITNAQFGARWKSLALIALEKIGLSGLLALAVVTFLYHFCNVIDIIDYRNLRPRNGFFTSRSEAFHHVRSTLFLAASLLLAKNSALQISGHQGNVNQLVNSLKVVLFLTCSYMGICMYQQLLQNDNNVRSRMNSEQVRSHPLRDISEHDLE
jgi:hypothetical protein